MNDFSFTERGNNAFRNDEGSAVIFAQVEGVKGKYVQAAFTPINYPAWDIGTVYLYGEELLDHIHNNLGGWYVDKCQLDINVDMSGCVVSSDDVIEEVAEHVMAQASYFLPKNTLLETEGMLNDAIDHSAGSLGYNLTIAMREKCYQEVMENF